MPATNWRYPACAAAKSFWTSRQSVLFGSLPRVAPGHPPRRCLRPFVQLPGRRRPVDLARPPARPEAACRAYCEAKGWIVVDVVSDLDVSGSDKGLRLYRPSLDKIRK